jgi:hypothetical protein
MAPTELTVHAFFLNYTEEIDQVEAQKLETPDDGSF